MSNVSCISCASSAIKTTKLRDELAYVVCKSCGHCEKINISGNAKEAFENAQAKYYGTNSHIVGARTSPFESEILEMRTKVVSRLLTKGSTVVEVGPGAGTFLEWLTKSGFHTTAIEHSAELAKHLADKLLVPVIVGDFETVDLAGKTADAFCSFHVIEHVSDPAKHLAKAFEVVRPGGFAFIATPNARSWEQQIPGNLSPNYDAAHLRIFSSNSLRRLSESVGWTVLAVYTPEYTIGWLRVASKILRRLRGEHEEFSAGKYSGGSGRGFRALAVTSRLTTAPFRFAQRLCGGGNELFLVLKK
jgi:2-polyprenyl-3-methyl-5-hydroxy-6-metoxy-1,4-benzoquinol methylase